MPLQPKMLPSQAKLLRLLDYESRTGLLFWKARHVKSKADKVFNTTFAGERAGYMHSHGYIVLEIYGIAYKAHRIIWKMMTGKEPSEWLDHKNCNRADNRWKNIREATQAQNSYNGRISPRNTSGHRCVSFIKAHGRFRAAVQIDGKKKHLGYYGEAIEAARAANKIIRETRGKFARIT
jgi:hypothetical protein